MIINKNIQVIFNQLNQIQSELYQSKFRTLWAYTHEKQVLVNFVVITTLEWGFGTTMIHLRSYMSLYQVLQQRHPNLGMVIFDK